MIQATTEQTAKVTAERQELAQRLMARHTGLQTERTVWDSFWQEIGNFVMPRKAEILSVTNSPSTAKQQELFDSTAIRANNVLANGQLAWMTPHETSWFSFDPPAELEGNEAVAMWFKRCTEIAHLEFARTNFYSEIHELYLDRGAFGTAAIFCEEGKKNALRFETWPIGTYSVSEDSEGYVDTASREFEYSLRQARDKFGAESLSEVMRKALEASKADPKLLDQKHRFIHIIYPREPSEIDPTKADPENMPIASVHIDAQAKHVVHVSGFRETPFFVTRFLKWSRAAYGWSPSWIALPEARQVNFLEKQMDALAELAAFPRMLVPSTFQGEIDTRANGVTYYDPANPNAIPREWATQGRYDIGEARSDRKRKAIEDAFHVDLFQMFAQLEKQMTATEVSERAAEKLIQFSPTFARMTTELFNPLVKRAFSILLRGGHFPPPPPEAIVQDQGGVFLPEPKISYSSRIAMSIRALENNAFNRTLQVLMPVAQLRPDVLDNFDFDKIIRSMGRNDGMPGSWLATEDAVKQTRAQRMQMQMAQAQAQQAQMMADAAGKAGSIDPASAVGQAIAKAS